ELSHRSSPLTGLRRLDVFTPHTRCNLEKFQRPEGVSRESADENASPRLAIRQSRACEPMPRPRRAKLWLVRESPLGPALRGVLLRARKLDRRHGLVADHPGVV